MGTRTHPRGQNISEVPLRRSKRWSHDKDEEEFVKYMSKLPGYLQGQEEECNNVLNVGVLDWGRLEKWKQHGRRAAQRSACKRAETKVSSSTTLGTLPNASSHQYHRCKIDDQVHASSLLGQVVNKAASRALQHSAHQVRCTLESEFASTSRDSLCKQEDIATCNYKSSGKGRVSTSSGLLSEMGNSNGSLAPKGNLLVRDNKKESEKRQEARLSWKQCADKLDGEEKTVGDSNAAEKLENHQVTNMRSRKHSRTDLSGDHPQMSSLDDNPKVTREVRVPRSCLLSVDLERDSEDMRLPLSCNKELSGGTRSHSKTASSRIFDQEKKRDSSSPSKRFSFSLGRLSRSFTFKEEDSSAGGQPLTSSDDNSKRCDGPSQSCNPEEKHCGSSSRVSPLRRLLDPLLKSKGSENVIPSKEERSTSSKPNRALFQLTTRNGIPLFQFVVDDDDNSRSILGATMKNSASSFKDDSVQYYTFYSVDEVKKKRSWLIHGHKEKQQGGFVYNVIGQMRLCNSSMRTEEEEKKSEKVSSSIIREAVLVDETEGVKGRKEVAAVVIKTKPAEENSKALEETTVIIPGGVHSFPEKGAPTPLVARWRSGGLCDCGGWDVGCKLHVLSNKTLLHKLDHSCFKLFAQEESDKDSGLVLAITELKTGIYRVEFGSFLSHLQAFFVCVTVITCASEEKTVSKTAGRSSSPFAPPLSPVGRV
ncbi:hypothetical protein Rs2_12575 [Raphanus sativus]|uniref:Uncharacterized protein LOC108843869 n=1 Tax=Raphanus sativus TaxID=3726 RepID=A0A6J0MKS8_RAPSA|nr:uncharacterized protein LOC108843869 [Raphanus sativus]XP_018472513.2 uncharacterized protein LOC108843869 [Raphanus sativus]KAJ4908917.1 hypothetical protein Rs2_12575 [Raphanus sativus]